MTTAAVGTPEVLAFVRAIADLLGRDASADAAVAAELARVRAHLRAVPDTVFGFPPSDHPIVAHVPLALASVDPAAAAAAAALQRVALHLPWRYGYPRRADAPDLGERIAFAELIGPEAPLRSDAYCLGVTAIAPHTLYPDHHHPAIELYRVVSGTAWWSAAGVNRLVPPGELVLHPSGVVHAMRTRDDPLVAIYAWTGDDVRTTSVYEPAAASVATC